MHTRITLSPGFTLIELMVAVSLLALLLALGGPSFNFLFRNVNLTAQANQFVAAVQLARSEAIRRNRSVTLSALADNQAQHWEAGWLVWVDLDNNAAPGEGEVMRRFAALDGTTLQGDTSSLRFAGSGFLDGHTPQAGNFTLKPLSCAGGKGRAIAVSTTGHPSVEEVTCQ